MKKFILFTAVFYLIFSLSFSISAQDLLADGYTYDVDGKTFYFSADTPFSEEQRAKIINIHINGASPVSTTYGLLCTLFGHSYETDIYTTITHCVNTTQPRCLEETFSANQCTRCDHTEKKLTNQKYIVCCE